MNAWADADVSRETCHRLEIYATLLKKWNPRINLVGRSTLDDVYNRHFADSAQLYPLAPHPVANWLDLGSGGGFPGLIVALLSMESGSPKRVTLVESDARKSSFLRTVIRETGAPADVITARMESLPPQKADVISARAVAPLKDLLISVENHLKPNGVALFPKGRGWQKEHDEARRAWKFDAQVINSKTDDQAVILKISGVTRV